MKQDKPKYNVFQNVDWMCRLAWQHRKRTLLFVLLMSSLEVLFNLTQLYIAPQILTLVERRESLRSLFITIGLFSSALFFLNFAKEYVTKNELFSRVDVRTAIIGMLGKKCNTTSYINTMKPEYIKLRDKAHMAAEGNSEATERIWHTLTQLLKNVGGFVVYLTILSNLDPVLLIVTIGTCGVGFAVSCYTNNWEYNHREEAENYYTQKRYVHSTAESLTIAKDIRIFGLQNWLNDLYNCVHDAYLDYRLRAEKVKLLADFTETILTVVRNSVAYVYLIQLALRENLSVGEFLLYFTAISAFTQWVMGILQESLILQKQSMDISQVREFLEFPEPFQFEGGMEIPKTDMYELKLQDVSFCYDGAENNIINNLTLTVHPGEKLAIVGLNGAGKSTLVKLLCGLLDPTEGKVLLNGQDIREFNRQEYYALFSAVFQEFSILDATVAENIAQSSDNIDYDKVNACIEQAGLTQAIADLPNGLETHVGREVFLDGVLFSGGQIQRLMLARALYKDGAILVLDEPTASLDPIAENDIYLKYNNMTKGKTALFISHRLASTRFCDRIILIADGGVAEEGTHESLLALGGEYAKLFEVQSRYYQEGREF